MVQDKPLLERMRENPDEIIIGSDDRDCEYHPDDPFRGLSEEQTRIAKELMAKWETESRFADLVEESH